MSGLVVVVVVTAAVAVPVGALWWGLARRRAFGTAAEHAAYEVLHLATEAAPHFRSGLTVAAASRAVRSLRRLLGSEALAITDGSTVLAWDGGGEHHRHDVLTMARPVLDGGSPVIVGPDSVITDSYIGPYTSLGPSVVIEAAEIEYSIVLAGAQLLFVGTRLESSIIGRGARIARAFDPPATMRMTLGDGVEVILK